MKKEELTDEKRDKDELLKRKRQKRLLRDLHKEEERLDFEELYEELDEQTYNMVRRQIK